MNNDNYKEIALQTAEHLLQIKAIKLNNTEPFKWASGWNSPIYCDNRKTLSYPSVRTFIRQNFVQVINEEFGDVDVIVGVATGGIAIGVLVAQELGKPFAYVRSKAKGHGMGNQIEGVVKKGQRVVVVEDLISTGGSSLRAVEALKEVGCDVVGMVAIFTYGFPVAEKAFKKADCKLFTLSNYNVLIEKALSDDYIFDTDIESLSLWRQDPANWRK